MNIAKLRINVMAAGLLSLLVFVSDSYALDINAPKEDVGLTEVKVISFFQNGDQSARIVIQPCAKAQQCLRKTVYVDKNTDILDNGRSLSLSQAKKLKWKYAVLTLGKSGELSMINRVPKLYSM